MNKKLRIIFSLFLLNTVFISLKANHILGGEITYKHLGAKKYELTAKIYRECGGIALNSVDFGITDGNTDLTISYTRVSIQDISNRCDDTGRGPCYPQNTASNSGVELHTYKATVDFGVSPYNYYPQNNSCKIYFYASQCCRPIGIIGIAGNFWVESMLDICNSKYKNTSPTLNEFNHLNVSCNQKFEHNLAGIDYVDYDSLEYLLVQPLNDHTTVDNYYGRSNNTIPILPYCPPNPGAFTCKPNPQSNPPTGFYFDKLSGNIILTPTDCQEISTICLKINEYRKDTTNKWVMVGSVTKDIFVRLLQTGYKNIVPSLTTKQAIYNFKINEKSCIEIVSKDTLSNNYDSINKGNKTRIKILNLPSGATFAYKDSSANAKTGVLCWQMHDSLIIKYGLGKKLIPITAQVKDNFCPYPEMVTHTFYIKVITPDSLGNLNILTFEDKNKDKKKNSNENGRLAPINFKRNKSLYYVFTNNNGIFNDSFPIGKIELGITSHPYFEKTTPDTSLLIKYKDNHIVNLGFTKNAGIYGRIFKDKNSNCTYDFGEETLAGVKVFTDSNKYVGISDKNGEYYIKAPYGTYNLKCDYKPFEYQINCPNNNTINITTALDSAYINNDFGIIPNLNFTDIGVNLQLKKANLSKQAEVVIYCKNYGYKTRKNFRLHIEMSKTADFKTTHLLKMFSNDSVNIYTDSIKGKGEKKINLKYLVHKDTFKAFDKIYFRIKTDNNTINTDSVKNNNIAETFIFVNEANDIYDKKIEKDTFKTALDTTINYTIRFQNNGTDRAQRIVVIDTIDTKYLHLSKFELNWSDYPCTPIFVGNAIHFIFDDINLPYFSTSGEKSIAAFNFTLGLKSKTNTEQSFTNKAAIYFDYEKPVLTAPAIGNIVSPVGIVKLNKKSNCINQENTLHFESKIPLNTGNQMILEMSDVNGDFSNAIILKTQNSSLLKDSINFTLPKNTAANNYKLQLRTTNPSSISLANSGIIDISTIKAANFSLTTNLANNEICEKDSYKIAFNNVNNQYQVLKNNVADNSLDFHTQYATQINKNDSFKIILKDGLNNCYDTLQIKPKVNPLPTANFTLLPTAICPTDSVLLTIDSNYLTDVAKFKALLYSKTTLKTIWLKNINNGDEFSIKTYTNKGCTNTSEYKKITVYNLPIKPIITANGNTLYTTSTDSIKWYRNNILAAQNVTEISNAASGNYTVKVKNTNGCEVLSDVYVHQYTAIASIKFSPYKIFPNPANGFLQLENVKDVKIRLNTIDGKEIMNIISNETNFKMPLDKVPTGLYLLNLTSANNEQYSQLINVVR